MYSFELHWQGDAIQMGTHNICFYKEIDKKYTGCNQKIKESLSCALIGVCAVIRSNTVFANLYMYTSSYKRNNVFWLYANSKDPDQLVNLHNLIVLCWW